METLHEDKYPSLVVLAGLLETFHSWNILDISTDIVLDHARVGKLSLLFAKPSGCAWCIWEEPKSETSDDKSSDTFEHEQPSPTRDVCNTIETSKDSGRDQRGESSGCDLCKVEDGNSRSDFFSGVKDGQDVSCTRIELHESAWTSSV